VGETVAGLGVSGATRLDTMQRTAWRKENKRVGLNKTCKEYSSESSGAPGRGTDLHLKAWKGDSRRQ
jgi:hypothetical protein